MTDIKAFNRILSYQERLKNEAQLNYQEAVHRFEQVATHLYNLLRKKEQVEKEYTFYLQSSGSVTTLATHNAYIEQIKRQIKEVQKEVDQERTKMDEKQEKLTEAHIEVKKFEKIIEKKKLKRMTTELYKENQEMDEISNRQSFNSRNR